MSQSQVEKAEVVETLKGCDCKHCQNLLQYVIDDGIGIHKLGYEDVFTPLKHGALRLTVDDPGITESFVFGKGDFIFNTDTPDELRGFDTCVEPFSLFHDLPLYDSVSFEVGE